jgi:hypothetical protein
MHSRPFQGTGDQAFLDSLGEVIGQPIGLGRFLVAHQDVLVAARPELVGPAGQAAHLSRSPSRVHVRIKGPESTWWSITACCMKEPRPSSARGEQRGGGRLLLDAMSGPVQSPGPPVSR